jgi:DNA-binding transcriptional ArsR family regulator
MMTAARNERPASAFDPQPVLAALADPTRRTVLDRVATGSGVTATAIAADLPVSRQAVARHLGILVDAGLVRATRTGREVRFRARAERVRRTARWLDQVAAGWDARLRSIREIAEGED